jgi:hypothetical protein
MGVGVALGITLEIAVFSSSSLGAPAGPLPMAAGLATVLIASCLRAPAGRRPRRDRRTRGDLFAAAAAAACLCNRAVSEPMGRATAGDLGFKGKVIALSGGIPVGCFTIR